MRIVVAALALMLAAAPARAAGLTVTGGSLEFPVTTLDGRSVVLTAQNAPTWRVDASGESGGWHVSLSLSDFQAAGRSLPASLVRFAAADGTLVALSGQPLEEGPVESGADGALDAGLKCLEASSGRGNGVYQWMASPGRFSLTVPADAHAGAYSATLTATLVVGP